MVNRHVPKDERSVFFTRVDAVRPSDAPLGIEPAADNNVMKITEDCLFMRSALDSFYGGRRSASWWSIVILVFSYVYFGAFILYGTLIEIRKYGSVQASSEDIYPMVILLYVVPLIAFSWPLIPWRRQLPIVFNRRKREVTCVIQGKCRSQSWDDVQAYIKDVTTVSAGGAPSNTGVLSLVFPSADSGQQYSNTYLRIGIAATHDNPKALMNRGIYGAAQIWEYIRLYMREGPTALPPTSALAPYRISRARDAIYQFNPLKILKVQHPAWLLFAVPFFFFVALPMAPLLMVSDILYMWLDRILPRRKWPKELIDACNGIWDGKES